MSLPNCNASPLWRIGDRQGINLLFSGFLNHIFSCIILVYFDCLLFLKWAIIDSDTVDYAINEIDVSMIVIKAQHKD